MLNKIYIDVVTTYIEENKPFEPEAHIIINYQGRQYDVIDADEYVNFEYGIYKHLLQPGKTWIPFSYLFEDRKKQAYYIYGI